jgi:hypothetical protein
LFDRVAARVPLDPLPWDEADRDTPANYTQASLF